MDCHRCDGDGKAHGADRPFEWTGPGTYPGPCPVCNGTGRKPEHQPIFTHCNCCGKRISDPEEDRMGMCWGCSGVEREE
jgi:hypothetical protein